MNKVAILGPGLLGGSIALALRRLGGRTVAVWARRAEAAVEVVEKGVADFASSDLAEVVRGAGLVVFCTPIGSMPALARELVPLISREVLITDVGSVKASVVAELGGMFRERGRFVGSHPMAGSEQAGIEAARADLFAGAVCIVTPDAQSDAAAVAEIAGFWEMLGCSVRQLSPGEHDEMVALVSHFPHLLAASLVEMVGAENAGAFELCGPGFRDTTRVAGGPPAMWAEILRTNRGAVRKSAEAMIEKLREIIKLLGPESPERAMHDFLTQAKMRRDRLRQTHR